MSTTTPIDPPSGGQRSLLELLSAMEKAGASDLFINEGRTPAARVTGGVRTLNRPAVERREIEALLQRCLTPAALEGYRERGDADGSLALPDGRRFRINAFQEQGRLGIVARAVPSGALSIAQLGLPEAVRDLAGERRGLILVTGATGSGKSTTLASMIHHINESRDVHIVTIEDPIEYVHRDRRARVTQREVGIDTPSFKAGLKHVLRQSPDVILVGELRDEETTEVAMQAALTGHLVLATVHTIDASQTLQRIVSLFPEHKRDQVAFDLSLSLRGVISQRLLPTVDGKDRAAACEVLLATPAVRLLLKEKDLGGIEDYLGNSTDGKSRSFNASLIELVKAEKVTADAAMAASTAPEELALNLKGMSSGAGGIRTAAVSSQDVSSFDMQSLLMEVTRRGASDLHLTTGRPPILRITGELVPLGRQELTEHDMRMLLHSIMTAKQRQGYELDREMDFAVALDERRRFRVNAYFQRGRMAAALRTIATTIPTAEELGIPKSVLDLGMKPHGLLLVVGPTGSGKSTTLACLVDQINRSRACRVMTIEDPVEYVHKSVLSTIDQREVGADTHSFPAALKYILRQDPDVILVGEMRDLETIGSSLTAAETGHLVLATLHSNEAAQAIDRIIDVFPSHQQSQVRSQLAASLVGVVSQRLLKRRDGSGRVAAFEVLVATPAIKNLIREKKMHQATSMMESGRKDGNIPLEQSLQELLRKGHIDRSEAQRFSKDPLFASTQQQGGRSQSSTMSSRTQTKGPGGWGRR